MDTLGVAVAGSLVARISRGPRPALIVGSGKAQEIVDECARLEADCIVFDDDVSPTQQRNWEKLAERTVMDRREIILDIFCKRAQTQEARLQTRLAQLEYQLPRLRRAWTHLERQRGGAGLRGGAGELQLELDQRRIRDWIASIKADLAETRKRRSVQRSKRESKPIPNAAIVGYTNAGKSTLLRAMTGADVLIEDQLFATLDPTTRRIVLPNNQEILVTDTVGFIRKLPHDLVASFKATLEETRLADFLIHVVDVSHPQAAQHVRATQAVLKELDALDKPTILALNKVDRLEDRSCLAAFQGMADHTIPISADRGEGLDRLAELMTEMRSGRLDRLILEIPTSRYDVVSLAHREGDILFEGYGGDTVWLEVDLPARMRHSVADFERDGLPEDLRPKGPSTDPEEGPMAP